MKDGDTSFRGPSAQDVLDYIRQHPDDLCEALRREHRTHQQSIAGSIVKILKSLGGHVTDARNEASVKWARQASELAYYGFPFV